MLAALRVFGVALRRTVPDGKQPARVVVARFVAAVLLGAVLLLLPIASQAGHGTDWVAALFTAVSAVTVTGLIAVDTPGYWSMVGEVVILGLSQVGGFGILTLVVTRRLKLRTQRSAQTETKTSGA